MAILNTQKYMKYMDNFDLSEEQKKEYITTLWKVAQTVVDKALKKSPLSYPSENKNKDRFTSDKQASIIFMNWLYADLECSNS